MFLLKNASLEIEAAFQETLAKNAVEKQTSGLTKVAEAMDLVANAAEIFDSVGMHKEAEYMTLVLESLAAKKKKKAPKAKKKDEDKEEKASKSKKKSDEATKDLTSDKMEDNLKHKGWVFNADDNAADDDNYASFLSRREDAKKTPDYWRTKAKEWYKKALEFEQKGQRFQSAECFKKADEYEAKYEELAGKAFGSHNDVDDMWAKDDEFYAKDERESDLARIMHEIEESTGPEPEFRADLEDEQDDDWDFPMHDKRMPRRF